MDEDLESERVARARADKARGQLSRELDELNERLEETGGHTAAQARTNRFDMSQESLADCVVNLESWFPSIFILT